ncbi:three-helix bundle dimerization domain-containing protein [Frigoribacterium sp. VKM Ac-2530]|uniref:three-helix bundle dimerization domain-containing protein n=1 Tax=Frigoribacterium sp. VKM Ac-2530 TaxID=2783822 RepID=UPI00188B36F4|nr:hypothetical protein [Frigoribacterium sp. VKM Ac-2530]MBF4578427.1 hypothetical protein [Frigoribacterium sp. VKM Ac-2530]
MTTLADTRSEHGRATLVAGVSAVLETRFPLTTLQHVRDVVGESHDAIVGTGVPIRAFLPNVIEHRARARLVAEER